MAPRLSKQRSTNGCTFPEKIPEGTILTTITKKQFRLGKSIGIGGFGEIYLCSDDISRPVGDDATMAVKIEPHSNGPLFVEMNFYIRAAAPEAISEFMQNKGLSSLGMPSYCGSGSLHYHDEKYRFLVMDRFGNDLQKIFQTGKKLFTSKVSFNLALKILDVLEYIHSKGYVHNDIKAQNLLLGHGRTKENDVYLVDFGLVSKYHRDGVHLEYKPDARKAHDGTIEYTSRDAHIGAHSRRSDLEILGYNLVHWMSGHLPWMDNLSNEEYVEAQKKGFMTDIKSFLERCFEDREYPDVLVDFLEYTNSLEFDSVPDYDRCRKMFRDALLAEKHPLDGKLDFTAPKQKLKQKSKKKRKHSGADEPDSKRQNLTQPTPSASPSPDINEFGALTRSSENSEDMDNWSWERVLCSDPELLIRQASRHSEADDESPLALQRRQLEEKKQAESLLNPTPAMLEVLQRMEDRERERENMTWQQQLQHLTGRKNSNSRMISWDLTPNPLTPAMEEVIKMRSKRVSVEIEIPITPEPSDSEESDDDDDTSSHEEYLPPSMSKKKPVRIGFLQKSSSVRRRLGQHVDKKKPTHSDDEFSQLSSDDDGDDSVTPKVTPAILAKRRGSVPHVVRVQNLPYSPDRIRNKGSPVKTPPTTTTMTTSAEVPMATSTLTTKGRKKVGLKGRRKLAGLNEEGAVTASTTTTVVPRGPSKSKKRKLDQEAATESVQEVPCEDEPVMKKSKKPLSVKFDTYDDRPKKAAKAKAGPRLANSPQRLSSIPVEVCIETLGSSSPAPPKRGRKPKKISPKKILLLPEIAKAEKPAKGRPKKVLEDVEPEPAAKSVRSTRSNEGRTTRSKDWSWEKVLLINPDKITKKKI